MDLSSDKILKLSASIRNTGVRVTRQRVALLAVLREAADHPDAEELYRRTKAIEPSVSIATIYRSLALFEERGVVHRHRFKGDSARYETASAEHHDHIVDIDTGDVLEFNSDKIEQLQNEIAAELGYDVIHHRMELYCRKVK
ncbi:MAG: Fur family transcriptional regulator [Pseudomonadota bacterium]